MSSTSRMLSLGFLSMTAVPLWASADKRDSGSQQTEKLEINRRIEGLGVLCDTASTECTQEWMLLRRACSYASFSSHGRIVRLSNCHPTLNLSCLSQCCSNESSIQKILFWSMLAADFNRFSFTCFDDTLQWDCRGVVVLPEHMTSSSPDPVWSFRRIEFIASLFHLARRCKSKNARSNF